MEKFIVTISREIEFSTAFEIQAPSMEQAKLLANKRAATLPTDTIKWVATIHSTTVSVFPKNKDLSS